jgi:hypothetical protein
MIHRNELTACSTNSRWAASTGISIPTKPNAPAPEPGTNLLYGLNEAVKMLLDEGLTNVFARHDRNAEATKRAFCTWGLVRRCSWRRTPRLTSLATSLSWTGV